MCVCRGVCVGCVGEGVGGCGGEGVRVLVCGVWVWV